MLLFINAPLLEAEQETFENQHSHKKNFTFLVYGDNREGWGDSSVHRSLLRLMRGEKASLILHTGDMVRKGNDQAAWQDFLRDIGPLSRSVPFQTVVGNHDLPWNKRDPSYYFFRHDNACFLALNSNLPLYKTSPQYRFVKTTLTRYEKCSPFIVLLHHPPYSAGKYGNNRMLQRDLVPLLEERGVDLVISGHEHNYQRIGPIRNILYLISGGGGAPLYDLKTRNKSKLKEELKAYKIVYHYLVIRIAPPFIEGEMKNSVGAVEDTFRYRY